MTNMKDLHEELGIPFIKTYIKEANIKKLQKAEKHENPLIPESLDYIPTRRSRRNRPKIVLLGDT